MNLYISDLHFGHKAVVDFDHRPFSGVEEMDAVLIQLWNSRVTKNDQVYILGDFAFHNEKPYSWYLKQLKGQKHLVIGNHDKKLLKDAEASSGWGWFPYRRRSGSWWACQRPPHRISFRPSERRCACRRFSS